MPPILLVKGSNVHSDFGCAEDCSCITWKADHEILSLAMLSVFSELSKLRTLSSHSPAAKNLNYRCKLCLVSCNGYSEGTVLAGKIVE